MFKNLSKIQTESLLTAARRIALISGGFLILLSLLMIVNFAQNSLVDPLDSPALKFLMAELKERPGDVALREQIRALDLLARKAYFTHMWQLRTGSLLLFVFVLLFLSSVKFSQSFKKHLPDLTQDKDESLSWSQRLMAQQWIFYAGIGLFALALVSANLSENHLSGSPGASEAASFPDREQIRGNWPNFRGPEGNGIVFQTGFPTSWDGEKEENIKWKAEITRPGFSSPIVWNNRVFLSGADKESQEIYCWDADSGALLWTADANGIPGSPEKRPDVADDTGYAAATMATDGTRVFAVYATGDIAAWDFEGNRLWAKNLGLPENHYGHSSSLICYQNLVLVQFDQNTGGRILALNGSTGNVTYDKTRDVKISWASPILVNTGSRDEFILNAEPFVMSFNPGTGEELWRTDCMMGEIAPSPAYADGMVFVVNEYARLAAIDVQNPEELVWEYDDYLAEVSSPLATRDFVLSATSYGSVGCFNAKTGDMLWSHDFKDGFYASPILADQRIYLMDLRGTLSVFEAFPEFKLLSQNPLGEAGVTTPAFINGRIYIRGYDYLYCIGE